MKERLSYFPCISQSVLLKVMILCCMWLLCSSALKQALAVSHSVDLTAGQSWTIASFTPSGSCCGAPSNQNCSSFEVILPAEANAVDIQLNLISGSSGLISYWVNGVNYGVMDASLKTSICLEGPGPHQIAFCRQGLASYSATFTRQSIHMNVSLQPIGDVCANEPMFLLEGGFPQGGTYYVNKLPSLGFDPSSSSPGEQIITYVYQDQQCIGSASTSFQLFPVPELEFPPMEICYGIPEVTLSGGRPLQAGFEEHDEFYYGNYVVNGVFLSGYAGSGIHEVNYLFVTADGCRVSTSSTLTILHPLPANAGENEKIAPGETAILAALNPQPEFTYRWEPSDWVEEPDNPLTVSKPLFKTTVFTLTVSNNNHCSNSAQKVVYVTGGTLSIEIPPIQGTFCPGEPVQLMVLPSGGSGQYLYQWSASPVPPPAFNSGIFNPVAYPEETTIFTVIVTDLLDPGNQLSGSIEVIVNSGQEASLSLSKTKVCGLDTEFVLSGGLPNGGYYSIPTLYLYGIESINPSQLPPGEYQVVYTLPGEGGCNARATQYLQILPRVQAFFYPSQDFCQTYEVNFLNLSENATTFTWEIEGHQTFSDLPKQDLPYSFPPENDRIRVTLTASNQGCQHIYSREVVITQPTQADFSFTIEEDNCAPLTLAFENQTTGPAAFFFWDFDDGSVLVEENPVHVFENLTQGLRTFEVNMTAWSANYMCSSQHSVSITVRPQAITGFGFDPPEICHGEMLEIFQKPLPGYTYQWDMGDGSDRFESQQPLLEHIFFNTTADPIPYTITQYVENSMGCQASLQQQLIVYPAHQASFAADIHEDCAPLRVQFTGIWDGAIASWYYDFDDGATSSEADPVHIFQNHTDGELLRTVRLFTTNGYGCTQQTSLDIIVNPLLEASFTSSPGQVCSNRLVNFTNTSKGSSSFEWDTGKDVYINEEPLFETYYNPGPALLEVPVTLTVRNQWCTRTAETTITVFPEVIAEIGPLPDEICSGTQIQLENRSENAGIFLWEFQNGMASVDDDPIHIFRNPDYDSPIANYSISLMAMNQHLCWDYVETSLLVHPSIEAEFHLSQTGICSPEPVGITDLSRGATSYLWQLNGQQLERQAGDFSLEDLAPGPYQLSLQTENAGGCTAALSRNFTIHPQVEASFAVSSTEDCHPLTVEFEYPQAGNAVHFSWNFGEQGTSTQASPTFTFTNFSHTKAENYDVVLTATSAHGCQAISHPVQITVNPLPDAAFSVENSALCLPDEVVLLAQAEGATQYSWDFDNGHILDFSSSPGQQYLYPEAGNYRILLTVENGFGCQDTISQRVVVYPELSALFAADGLTGCGELPVQFTNLTQGAVPSTQFRWDYGNGQTSSTSQESHSHTFFNHTLNQQQLYQVSLLADNGACQSSFSLDMPIRVNPMPLAEFTIPELPGCGQTEVLIENKSLGANTLSWLVDETSFTPTVSSAGFMFSFPEPAPDAAGQHTITLNAMNDYDCLAQYSQDIRIIPGIEASFSFQAGDRCHPVTACFENNTEGSTSLLWQFAEGVYSQETNPSHIFFNTSLTQAFDYPVSLTATNSFGCTHTHTETITVNPVPLAAFSLSETSGCASFEPQIHNLSLGENLRYEWDFGNGQSNNGATTFTHAWDNTQGDPQRYNVWLSAENLFGCSDESLHLITVYPRVEADFTTSDGLFEGCSPFTVQFQNLSLNTISHSWNFGPDQSGSGSNPIHIFSSQQMAQLFPVELTAKSQYNCRASMLRYITVHPAPVANFLVTPRVQVYPATTVSLENLSSPGQWEHQWDFGDGNQFIGPEPLQHSYSWQPTNLETKHYDIRLRLSNHICHNEITRQVTILSPVPTASFTSQEQGCSPLEVQFANQSQGAHSYRWFFHDGSVSLEENPRFIFYEPGLHQVMLVAYSDGGSDTTYSQVRVFEDPVVKFRIKNPLLELHQPLELINLTEGAATYLWDFGDNNTSDEFEPTHFYSELGLYSITLTAFSDTEPSCKASLTLKNAVRVQEGCRVVFPNAFMPDSEEPEFQINRLFKPLHEGIDNYTLEVFTRWGELIFRSEDPNTGWDGTYRDKPVKMDVYVWKMNARCDNGKDVKMSGDVTLIR